MIDISATAIGHVHYLIAGLALLLLVAFAWLARRDPLWTRLIAGLAMLVVATVALASAPPTAPKLSEPARLSLDATITAHRAAHASAEAATRKLLEAEVEILRWEVRALTPEYRGDTVQTNQRLRVARREYDKAQIVKREATAAAASAREALLTDARKVIRFATVADKAARRIYEARTALASSPYEATLLALAAIPEAQLLVREIGPEETATIIAEFL